MQYEYDNITLMRQVLSTLHTVSSRRTSPSFSVAVINTILKTLEKDYNFLSYIETQDLPYAENMNDIISISHKMNRVEPTQIGKAVEALIRVICMDLKDDAGLYFINEFKDSIGDGYTLELIIRGVNFDNLSADIEKLYLLRKRKKTVPITDTTIEQKKKVKPVAHQSLFGYTWDNVATWKYENNICVLYDSEGMILDKLPLDTIVQDYVRRLSQFDEFLKSSKKPIDITENDDEFIQLLYSRDLDVDFAIVLLKISRSQLDAIIHRLLDLEILEYSSSNEIKLTEKGITYLLAKKVIVARETMGSL